MATVHSNLKNGNQNKMKLKLWLSIGFAVVIGLSAIVWVSFHDDKVTTPISEVSTQNNSVPSAGPSRKWFSAITPEAKVSGTQIPALDADGHLLDLNGLSVNLYVKSLYDAAGKGDVKAAFNIYSAETLCTKFQQNGKWVGDDSQLKAAKAVCEDFNISPRERLDYLRAAAQGGNVQAQIAFINDPPDGIDTSRSLDLTDPLASQYQKDSMNYLTQAATKGNSDAMQQLMSIYEDGVFAPQNIQLSLTYELAALELRHPNTDIPDNAVSINRLTGQLTPDQINAARTDASALIKSCCKSQ